MTPEMFQAIFAGVTLLILWSVTILGAGIWIMRMLSNTKDAILADFNAKHTANSKTVAAINALVIRHDVMLNAEFGSPQGNGRSHLRG